LCYLKFENRKAAEFAVNKGKQMFGKSLEISWKTTQPTTQTNTTPTTVSISQDNTGENTVNFENEDEEYEDKDRSWKSFN